MNAINMAAVCLVLLYHKLFFCHCWLFGGGRSPLPQNLGIWHVISYKTGVFAKEIEALEIREMLRLHRSSPRPSLLSRQL